MPGEERMNREKYISDKLYHMGDRLMQNCTQPSAVSPAAEAENSSAVKRPAVSAASGRSDEFSRTLRDLEGRIAYDRAAVDAELAALELRKKELEKFQAILDECNTALPSLCGDLRALDHLRINYFAGSGRFNGTQSSSASVPEQPEITTRQAWKFVLFLALVILVGAGILAVTLLVLFV